jgi:ketosteroid isomerase-like protein
MSEEATRLARAGFEAWQRGDFETVERMLDPAVRWRSFEPGEWDCGNREDVMNVVRERYEQGFARGRLAFADGGEDASIVVSHPQEIGGDDWPEQTATVIRFRGGRVIGMQDYRTLEEAVAATGGPG